MGQSMSNDTHIFLHQNKPITPLSHSIQMSTFLLRVKLRKEEEEWTLRN